MFEIYIWKCVIRNPLFTNMFDAKFPGLFLISYLILNLFRQQL